MADLLLVNKADGDLVQEAKKTQQDYKRASGLLRRNKKEKLATLSMSALHEQGITDVWSWLKEAEVKARQSGRINELRREQAVHWTMATIEKELQHRFWSQRAVRDQKNVLFNDVQAQKIPPTKAALLLLDTYFQNLNEEC